MTNEKALKILEVFLEATNNIFNVHLREWKDKGGRITGYTCSYLPEEMISAAGCIPFRLRGKRDISLESVDGYMGQFSCTYVTHLYETVLREDLNFLDGIVVINTCDHMRRIYDNARFYNNYDFVHLTTVPRKSGRKEVEFFREELEILKNELEAQYSVHITDDRLWESIRLHNETRSLRNELYHLRKQERPPITGAETLAVMVAGTAMPKEEYNGYLKEFIDELRTEKGNDGYRARLMVVGPSIEDPEFFRVIEDSGALIVTDSTCYGTRLFQAKVDESDDDPLSALARYYLTTRPGCPHSVGQSKRSDYVKRIAQDYAVNGIIGARIKFCENWGMEHHMLDDAMKEDDIPFLILEKEYQLGGVGQVRTRVQAFLEIIEGRQL